MTRQWLWLILPVLIMVLSGCGTRPGSVHARPRTRTTPAIGDQADYTISTRVSSIFDGNDFNLATGSRSYDVSASPGHGRSVPSYIIRTFDLTETITQHLAGSESKQVVVCWFGADAPGNVYLLAESLDGLNWDVVRDTDLPVYMPSDVKPGSSWQYVVHFASGNSETSVNRCVGLEKLQTPSGAFLSYKIEYTDTRTGVRGADVTMTGQRWLGTTVPYLFEVGNDFRGQTTLGGIPTRTHTLQTLKAISFSR
jgi:hypothetical protein